MAEIFPYRDTVVRGETVKVGHRKTVDFLGPNATFEDCVIELGGSARGFSIVDVLFKNCRIKTRKPLNNFQFETARFEGCRFEGTFKGCRFGGSPDLKRRGFHVDCDFSAATLHLCDFIEHPVDSFRWPAWPGFVVLEPLRNREDWLAIAFPPAFRSAQEVIAGLAFEDEDQVAFDEVQRHVRAVTVHLPTRLPDVDPERIWPLIETKAYIVFADKDRKAPATADERSRAATAVADLQRGHDAEEARLRPFRVWGDCYGGRIQSIRRQSQDVAIVVDMSFLREKVADALAAVTVVLQECRACVWLDPKGERRPADELPADVFKIQAWREEDTGISVSSWAKKRGQLLLDYTDADLRDASGAAIDRDAWAEILGRYYR